MAILEPVRAFEERLATERRWALDEGSLFLDGKGRVQESLRRIAKRLDQIGVDYAVAGGMALFQHGYQRFTNDVDILVAADGLKRIHESLEGLGYVPPFPNSKHLRDAESGVKIEFLVAGGFPGDGKPKPIAFPNPSEVSVDLDGIRCLSLEALINLKIASGMSGAHRGRDLVDVQELSRVRKLGIDFADRLHPYVQAKFRELWTAVQPVGRRFLRRWKSNYASPTFDDLIANANPTDAVLLQAMSQDGIAIEPTERGFVRLVTTDPTLADKFEMPDESDYMEEAAG